MALTAVIFDLDGTLVDSNPLHIEAFRIAFEQAGYKIAPDRIAVEVGKGGDNLVPAIIGASADRADGEKIREAQPKAFRKLAEQRGRIDVFPRATDLIRAVRDRGLKAILGTSSNTKQLEVTEQFSGVKWRDLVDDVVQSDDIQRSKPHPDVVHAAVGKLGPDASPAQCAMIGDTVYDAESARAGGVVTLGVLTGTSTHDQLRSAGARAVYRGVWEVLDKLPDALALASPGRAVLTLSKLESLMRRALGTAEEAIGAGEAPIGAALFHGDGETLIAAAFNELNRTNNPAAHAEMVAFARAAGRVSADARDLILVSTLEPCVMCTGAAMECAVDTIVYALRAPADGGSGRVTPPLSPESQMPRILGDVLADQSRTLFKRWLRTGHVTPRQQGYVEQLLGSKP
jgi:beta-phosphoglucomutase-like phosphatase (HAD superfamily)/tRNA(Arg) A34 adenosine deaminase TadA